MILSLGKTCILKPVTWIGGHVESGSQHHICLGVKITPSPQGHGEAPPQDSHPVKEEARTTLSPRIPGLEGQRAHSTEK